MDSVLPLPLLPGFSYPPMAASSDGREACGLSRGEEHVITAHDEDDGNIVRCVEGIVLPRSRMGALRGEGWMDEKTTVVRTRVRSSSVGEGRRGTLGGR